MCVELRTLLVELSLHNQDVRAMQPRRSELYFAGLETDVLELPVCGLGKARLLMEPG